MADSSLPGCGDPEFDRTPQGFPEGDLWGIIGHRSIPLPRKAMFAGQKQGTCDRWETIRSRIVLYCPRGQHRSIWLTAYEHGRNPGFQTPNVASASSSR